MSTRKTLLKSRLLWALGLSVLALQAAYYGNQLYHAEGEIALPWRVAPFVVLAAVGVNLLGVFCDFLCWRRAYHYTGLRHGIIESALTYCTFFAAQLTPLQLGRIIRPEYTTRLTGFARRPLYEAEGALFVIDVGAIVLVITASALGMLWGPAPCLVLPAGAFLAWALGTRIFGAAAAMGVESLGSPAWDRSSIVFILALRVIDWFCVGFTFYLLISMIDGGPGVIESTFFALAGNFAGAASSIPGGIGVNEGVLGVLLHARTIDTATAGVVIGLYRLLTFWSLIPIGWAAVALLERRLARRATLGA